VSGPWEDFQPKAKGPWDDFATPATKAAAPTPQMGAIQSIAQSDEDHRTALKQGVNPNATSEYFPNKPQRLGDLEEFEWGQGYKLDGKETMINPKTDFVARDPSGKMAVYARNKDTNESAGVTAARALVPGLVVNPVAGIQRGAQAAGKAVTAIPETSGAVATQRAADVAQDVQAFQKTQTPLFGPAFNEGPVASIGKQLSETPFIGAPLRNKLDDALTGARDAAYRIADDMAPNASVEQTGIALQRGLDRYRTAGVKDLEPGVLDDLAIPSRAPVQAQDVMSKGAAQRAAQVDELRNATGEVPTATTSRGVVVPAARSRDLTITARRGVEDMSDAELASIVRAPSQETSFAARQEALYEAAWRQIPARFKVNEHANANLIRAVNTQNAFRAIERAEQASGISGGMATGRFAGVADRLETNVTLPNLRAMRTEVGRALSNFGLYDTSLDRGQLKGIYAALSRDIEVAVQDMANRARLQSRVSNNRPDYVAPAVAKQAEGALYALRRADRYTRLGIESMDNFSKIVGTQNPQQAVGILLRATLDGTKGNMQMLRTARAALRDDEWNQISALVLRQLGTPVGSARGTTEKIGFSVNSFLTRWQNMAPEAKKILFGSEHAGALDDLLRVVSRLANVEALANTSRSATNALNMGGVLGVIGSLATGAWQGAAAIGAAGLGASVLMSRPIYVKWTAQYAALRAAALRTPSSQSTPALIAHVQRFAELAKKDPQLLPLLKAISEENGIQQGSNEQNKQQGEVRH
jgi:hypothetical protein